MDENLQKQLFEMNEAIVNFLEKFTNFQKKRIINEDICINLHKLIKNIDNYMNDDLKLSDIKCDNKGHNEDREIIQSSDNTVITIEEQKPTSSNNVPYSLTPSKIAKSGSSNENVKAQNVKKQNYQLEFNTNTTPNITNNQQSNNAGCILNDDFFDRPRRNKKELNKIDKLLQDNQISSILKNIAICKMCREHIPSEGPQYENHFFTKHYISANLNHIEKIRKWGFFCNLCQKDIGCEDDIVEHVEKNQEHLKKLSRQADIKKDNKQLIDDHVKVVRNRIPTCKLCNLQIKLCDLQSHLVSAHSTQFEASMLTSKTQVSKNYTWKTNEIYHCTLCRTDIGVKENIPYHNSDRLHIKILRKTQKNFEIKNGPDINQFISNRVKELAIHSPDRLLVRHRIDRKDERVFTCKACERDIGLMDKMLLHLTETRHLTKLYHLEFGKNNVQVNNANTLNKEVEQQSQQPINNNNKSATFDFKQELEKHHIIKRFNIYHCKLCMRDIGLENKLEIHFKHPVHVRHLFKIETKHNSTQNLNNAVSEEPSCSDGEEIDIDNAIDDDDDNDDKLREIFCSKIALMNYLKESQNNEINPNNLTFFIALIELKLRNIYPHIKAYPYGPVLYGLGNIDSDYLSIFLDTDSEYYKLSVDSDEEIEKKAKYIYDYLCENFNSYSVSFRYDHNDESFIYAKVDNHLYEFTFVDGMEHAETQLIKYMFKLQPLCQKLCDLLVKMTKYYNLNTYFHTEVIVWMVIFYLQINNYLPSVKIVQDNNDSPTHIGPWQANFKCMEKHELNLLHLDESQFFKLIKEILTFYSTVMNYNDEIICPYLGRQIQKSYADPLTLGSEFKSLQEFYQNDNENQRLNVNTTVCVQHPIELNYNTAEDIYDLALNAFIESLEHILNNIKW